MTTRDHTLIDDTNRSEGVPRDAGGRWLPGNSANPGGRPKFSLYKAVQTVLAEVSGEGDAAKTGYEKVARALVTAMLKGEVAPAALIMDREDPKVVRNENYEVTAFEHSMDKLIDGMMETPEGEARLGAMMRGEAPAPSTPEEPPSPPVGPPNEQVRKDGTTRDKPPNEVEA